MLQKKKEHEKIKSNMHARNKHRERYNFQALISTCPQLAPFVKLNNYNDHSIDFSNAEAVMMLNKALLKHYYGIDHWKIPLGYLCPPIPGRSDYIHYAADLLGSSNHGIIPTGNHIKCLDIGVGANCIYPILGNKEYGWSFVGSDVDRVAIQSATEIVEANLHLKGNVKLRLQENSKVIFRGIIRNDEHFDLTICNPPFHASLEAAQTGTLRKLSNLNHKRITKPTLNFGGQHKELWTVGGEEKFVQTMISQSKIFSSSCFWFSTLISKSVHLKSAYLALKIAEAIEVKTISMSQGNKTSRIVAWTFLDQVQQNKWVETRWNKPL